MNPSPRIRRLRRWFSRALDLLYPPCCAVCGDGLQDAKALCDACDGDLPRVVAPFCDTCGEMFSGQIESSFSCPNCRHLTFSFEFARAALCRDARSLNLIHGLKYGRKIELAKDLGRLGAEAFGDPRLDVALKGRWPLVPVPLHRKRQQDRYFNQAGEIARAMAQYVDLPVLHSLRRTRATSHQTKLTRAQRLENLRGSFVMSAAGMRYVAQHPAGVVLVDDVFTTGSTVDECSKILRRAGFQQVVVVTVMRS